MAQPTRAAALAAARAVVPPHIAQYFEDDEDAGDIRYDFEEDDAVDIPHVFEEDEEVNPPHYFEADEALVTMQYNEEVKEVDTPKIFGQNKGGRILDEDMLDQGHLNAALEMAPSINGRHRNSFTYESRYVDIRPRDPNILFREQNNNKQFTNSQSSSKSNRAKSPEWASANPTDYDGDDGPNDYEEYDAPPSPPFRQRKFQCRLPGCTSKDFVWRQLDNFRKHLEMFHEKELPNERDRQETIQHSIIAGFCTDQELPLQNPVYAAAALNIVSRLSDRNLTLDQVNDLLRGMNPANIKDYYNVEGYGVARNWAGVEVQRLLERLLVEYALEEHPVVDNSGFSSSYIQLGYTFQLFLMEPPYSTEPVARDNLTDSVPASCTESKPMDSLETDSVSSDALQSGNPTGDLIFSAFDVPGNWSGRGQHVEFSRNEDIPLEQGVSLGRGSSADVHEVTCNGIKLARKQIYCTKRVKINDVKRELDVLKKLNHKHVITLVGSYTQIRVLGLLLYPAAVCDLAVYLDELDEEQRLDNVAFGEGTSDLWEQLGIPSDLHHVRGRLKRVYGCLANAVQYLHNNNIRHKDLKPRNILLDRNEGLYVTDFGLSRDTSDASTSVTNGIDRGTYKYCAPEVARWEPRGRAADIYSLGCVFLEMCTVYRGLSLVDFDNFRTKNEDRSFQNCPEKIVLWMIKLETVETSPNDGDEMFIHMIQTMMLENAALRPGIYEVCSLLRENGAEAYFSGCCRSGQH